MLRIANAVTPQQIATVRRLLLEYRAQLGIDLSYQGFDDELRMLPGAYALPRGRLLLAHNNGQPVGCVALRAVGDVRAEVKRLYVCSESRGIGVGQALMARLIAEARDAGYVELVLDTLPTMQSAQRLYEQCGFRDVPAFGTSPIAGTRFLALRLDAP